MPAASQPVAIGREKKLIENKIMPGDVGRETLGNDVRGSEGRAAAGGGRRRRREMRRGAARNAGLQSLN